MKSMTSDECTGKLIKFMLESDIESFQQLFLNNHIKPEDCSDILSHALLAGHYNDIADILSTKISLKEQLEAAVHYEIRDNDSVLKLLQRIENNDIPNLCVAESFINYILRISGSLNFTDLIANAPPRLQQELLERYADL